MVGEECVQLWLVVGYATGGGSEALLPLHSAAITDPVLSVSCPCHSVLTGS